MKHEGRQSGTLQKAEDPELKQVVSVAEADKTVAAGLSVKLLLLTIFFVMLAEVLIYVPSIANFRNSWLQSRLATASVAASILSEVNTVAPRLQEELLSTTGALAISLDYGDRRMLIAMKDQPQDIRFITRLDDLTPFQAIYESFLTLFHLEGADVRVIGSGRMGSVQQVDVVFPISILQRDMLAFSARILGLSLVISIITASLVYVSLRALFVRPLQRVIHSMEGFGSEPENPARIIVPSDRKDELGLVENRLSEMQQTLSKTLQQKQRLADLGLAVSKINHDLRNLLASAQLFLERLEHVNDPTVSRLAPKILATLDRAVGYTQAVMSYGKAEEGAPKRRLLSLHKVCLEVGDVLGVLDRDDICFEIKVPEMLEVDGDPEQLFRVLLNLSRNALQALETDTDDTLVKRIEIEAERQGNCVHIAICDTGPGIPDNTRKQLFRAFHSGSKLGGVGLGLAIAAELVRAHGGTISLDPTSLRTCFRLTVPDRPTAHS